MKKLLANIALAALLPSISMAGIPQIYNGGTLARGETTQFCFVSSEETDSVIVRAISPNADPMLTVKQLYSTNEWFNNDWVQLQDHDVKTLLETHSEPLRETDSALVVDTLPFRAYCVYGRLRGSGGQLTIQVQLVNYPKVK